MNFKREALDLEDRIESKLQDFAGLLSRQDTLDWEAVRDMEIDIQQDIDQLRTLIQNPEAVIEKKTIDDYSRHITDYNREYQRVKNLLTQAKDREDLMSSIQSDIRYLIPSLHSRSHQDAQSYLLDERIRIDKSRNVADDILEQALHARDDLGRQRSMIFDGRSRLGNTLARFPMLNSLLGKIRFRKTKDMIIMSLLIGGGFCFFIWYFLM